MIKKNKKYHTKKQEQSLGYKEEMDNNYLFVQADKDLSGIVHSRELINKMGGKLEITSKSG